MTADTDDPRSVLREAGAALVAGVEQSLTGWLVARASAVLAAWGRLDASTRADAGAQAAAAAASATRRVSAELGDLFAQDPAARRRTPLEVVRSAHREPGRVLARVGVPVIVRDELEERSRPDDRYDLAPRTFGDLDPRLTAVQLAWGAATAVVVRQGRLP